MRHLPLIYTWCVPHKDQRYDTAADYVLKKSVWEIKLSKCTARSELAVLIHELVEAFLVKEHGINPKAIDKWDMVDVFKVDPKWSKDPGMSKKSPYHREHMTALYVEKAFCFAVGLSWKKHNETLDALKWRK
jgi:hypothetical protein